MRSATIVETLYTLHTLWKSKNLETATVVRLLKEEFNLELTSITNGGITAESMDGKSKYLIK